MYLYSDNINFLAVDGGCGMATLSLCDGAFPHDVLRTAHLIEVQKQSSILNEGTLK